MRKILKFIVTYAMLWVGMTYFPSNIQITGIETLILVSVIPIVFDMLYGWVLMISALTTPMVVGCFPLIMCVILAPALNLIELLLMDRFIDGFDIIGVWTYIILFVVMSTFTIKIKTSDTSKNKR